jgi:hypothetical protein
MGSLRQQKIFKNETYCKRSTVQIIDWFKRFKKDCPDGRLTVDHLRTLFRQVFPNGKQKETLCNIFKGLFTWTVIFVSHRVAWYHMTKLCSACLSTCRKPSRNMVKKKPLRMYVFNSLKGLFTWTVIFVPCRVALCHMTKLMPVLYVCRAASHNTARQYFVSVHK